MLDNLLPGIRDLRTPLATGILYIAALGIQLANWLPDEPVTGGLLGRLYELGGMLGVGALISVLTFTAYLVGVLLSCSESPVMKSVRQVARIFPSVMRWSAGREFDRVILTTADSNHEGLAESLPKLDSTAILSPEMKKHITHLAESIFESAEVRGVRPSALLGLFQLSLCGLIVPPENRNSTLDGILDLQLMVVDDFTLTASVVVDKGLPLSAGDQELAYPLFIDHVDEAANPFIRPGIRLALEGKVFDDLQAVSTRLNFEDADSYDVYDRLISEAEFRYSVSVPVALVGTSIAASDILPPWLRPIVVLLSFLSGFALATRGERRESEALDSLIQPVLAGLIKTPVQERVDAILPGVPASTLSIAGIRAVMVKPREGAR